MIKISFIICTYNRSFFLEKCLEGLFKEIHNTSLLEVIIVDNNSTDNTAELVLSFAEKSPLFRRVIEQNQGLSHARNRGFHESKGEYLVYLDDDAIPGDNYLSEIEKVLEKYQPDIMGGPIYPYYTTKKPWWFLDEYEIRRSENESGFSTTCLIKGGNFIIKRGILKELGLFDINYGMIGNKIGLLEERKIIEMYRRTRTMDQQKIYYSVESAVLHHTPENKMNIPYIIRRSYKAGVSAYYMFKDLNDDELHERAIFQIIYSIKDFLRTVQKILKTKNKFLKYSLKSCIDFICQLVWSYGYFTSQWRVLLIAIKKKYSQ